MPESRTGPRSPGPPTSPALCPIIPSVEKQCANLCSTADLLLRGRVPPPDRNRAVARHLRMNASDHVLEVAGPCGWCPRCGQSGQSVPEGLTESSDRLHGRDRILQMEDGLEP